MVCLTNLRVMKSENVKKIKKTKVMHGKRPIKSPTLDAAHIVPYSFVLKNC